MNKALLKQIIVENQEFVNNVELFKREAAFEEKANYVLVGPRRAGKTFTLFEVIKDKLGKGASISDILYINFEDERLLELTGQHLNLLLEAYRELFDKKPVLFLDEIQNITGWEKFARRLADQQYILFITGSNAQMLSAEIASTLGGRFIVKEIFPLSFREYLHANGLFPVKNWEFSEQRFAIRKLFDDYFYFGGFPEIIRFNDKQLWLRNLYNKIFFGDIVTRYKIRNDFALKLMIKKLSEATHDEISFTRIRHIIQSAGIKIGTATLIEYVKYLEASWLLFGVKNYFAKTGQRESKGKYYFIDNGILSLFLLNPETILLENMVAVHLKQKYDGQFFYLKKTNEVDFYVPGEKMMIQVAYNTDAPETEKHETAAINSFDKIMETEQRLVITLDTEKQITSNGHILRFIPVWKWLLAG